MSNTEQKNWDKTFMDFAIVMAGKSHCKRLQVGAVITLDNRVISCGYNGTPSGFINCDEANRELDVFNSKQDSDAHHVFSDNFEIHAEMNAILDMAKRGLSAKGCTLYTTVCPCKNCAKLVIAAGIKRIVYLKLYDRDAPCKNLDKDINEIIYDNLNGVDLIKLMAPRGVTVEKYEE